MNYSDYRFTLDVQIHQAQVSVPVTLGDTARKLYIGLTDGRKPYVIAEGCIATFNAKKPDGKTIKNNCVIEKNAIIYEFTEQTTNVEGVVNCDVTIYGVDGKVLYSPQFILVVDKKVVRDEEALSTLSADESTTLQGIITAELGRVDAENERIANENGRKAKDEVRDEIITFFEDKGGIIVSEAEPESDVASFWLKTNPSEEEISLLDSTDIVQELSNDTDKIPSAKAVKNEITRVSGFFQDITEGVTPVKYAIEAESAVDAENAEWARRAQGDTNGNVIHETYATKADLEESIGDAFDVHTSPNLLNMEATIHGIGMAANGKEYSGAAYLLTDYIPVSEGDVLTVQRKMTSYDEWYIGEMRWVCAFNAEKEIMSNAGSNYSLMEYTVPSGVSFVRITIGGWGEGTIAAIVKGTDILPYEPYGTTLILKETSHNAECIREIVNEVNNGNIKPLALPPTTYGFVGYPITTYFYNIMGYNPNDVYMYFYGQNEGKKQYADRCEYIPTSAKTEYTRLYVYDHNYKQLNEHMYPMIIKDASVKDSLKVLVIGDSTVNAGKETQKMLDLAEADGYGLTLLGTRGTSPNLHEGRAGWRANIYATMSEALSAGVMTQNPFYNPTTSAFDFSYYMTQQGYSGVDCVFIQLGINDVFAAKDHEIEDAISTFISSMNALVNSIHEYDANVKIVVNLVIPCGTDQDAFTEYYNLSQTVWRCKKNTYMANIALLENFKGVNNVYLSPYNAAIDTESNLRGDVHPIDTGYEQLGTQMYSFMRAIN